MSDESEQSSSSESEDEEPTGDILDKDFFKTLSHLKNKDPVIYDESVNFFKEETKNEPSTSKKNEHMYLRDYTREVLLGNLKENDDLPYVEVQKQLKNSFKSLLNESDDEDLFQKKEKTEEEKLKEEEEYITWLKGRKEDILDNEKGVLKPLRDYWNNPELDKGEEFLKDYILNQKWKEKEDEINDSDLSEDGELLEAQEDFEREYNFKNDDANLELKRFPRKVDGSLRKKDDSRKKKRAEITERKKEEKNKKKLQVKKAQKEKLNEIKARIEQLKEATGNDALGVDDNDILGDFDPEQHDKLMQQICGDDFYSQGDIEKPQFEEEEETRTKKKKDRKRKNKKQKLKDITDIINPNDDNFEKVADEFYSLDCEDFIDDIPCRFKYREVVPNDYGLTIEEILAADDNDLNKWVPTSKLYKIRPPHVEKNEIKIYKQKGMDLKLKEKLLPSLFKQEESNDEDQKNITESNVNNKVKPKKQKNLNTQSEVNNEVNPKKQKNLNAQFEVNNEVNPKKQKNLNTQSEVNNEEDKPKNIKNIKVSKKRKFEQLEITDNPQNPAKKKKKNKQKLENHQNIQNNSFKNPKNRNDKRKKFNDKKQDPFSNISDTRLLAYDIKPKKFRSKMKFRS